MDPNAPMGVTMHMPGDSKSFYGNIFCAEYDNPKGSTGCFGGRRDCAISAALYNHLMLLTEKDTFRMFQSPTGIVFNQTLVENYLSRCSYAWDGGTELSLNLGCGIGAAGGWNCSSPNSAFYNVCPSTGKICAAQDAEVKAGLCKHFGGNAPGPLQALPCTYFPGPALDYHKQEDWKPVDTRENLKEMLVFRTRHQEGVDEIRGIPKISMHNEIILDARLLMPLIHEDPAWVIPAFVYVKGNPMARADAIAMRDDFCAINHCVEKIPVLAVDLKAVTRKQEPIFVALPEDSEEEV